MDYLSTILPTQSSPEIECVCAATVDKTASEVQKIIDLHTRTIEDSILNKSKKAYDMLRKLTCPQRSKVTVGIGVKAQRLKSIVDTCASQLHTTDPITSVAFKAPEDLPDSFATSFSTAPFSLAELSEAAGSLQNYRSPGIDKIPNEFLKCEAVASKLLPVFNKCLETGTTPSSWSHLLFSMVPKKGNMKDPTNWRYIALLPTVSKLYNLMLKKRLEPIEKVLRPNQNGFRPKRGVHANLLSLFHLLSVAKSSTLPFVFLFVDFKNAFPSVSVAAVKAALEAYQVPPVLVSAVLSL
jgi:hypothetical protein